MCCSFIHVLLTSSLSLSKVYHHINTLSTPFQNFFKKF
uniref:Uncharacterized protein n=1 Tax=Podoviridae sp. ctTSE2 TaxID=2825251 RepID=A0A8S5Q664_9CAUD|nr:MAG TPA: hypothetical protein [Podoviridae sp. ctTSE2]